MIEETQKIFEKRLKDEKRSILETLEFQVTHIRDIFNKMEEEFTKSLEILKEALETSKDFITEKMSNLMRA